MNTLDTKTSTTEPTELQPWQTPDAVFYSGIDQTKNATPGAGSGDGSGPAHTCS